LDLGVNNIHALATDFPSKNDLDGVWLKYRIKAYGGGIDWDVYWQLKYALEVIDGDDLHGTPLQPDAPYLDGSTVLRSFLYSPIRAFWVKQLGE
jgi:hypothetical protein